MAELVTELRTTGESLPVGTGRDHFLRLADAVTGVAVATRGAVSAADRAERAAVRARFALGNCMDRSHETSASVRQLLG